jgi:Skp family chaperone for outer membrane proteins
MHGSFRSAAASTWLSIAAVLTLAAPFADAQQQPASQPAPAAPAAAQQKAPAAVILVVDMERVVVQSAAGKQAQAEIQTKMNALQTRANALQGQLKTEADAIQAGQANQSLAGPALETRVKAFGDRQQAAQREVGQAENEIQRSRQFVLKQISDAVNPILTVVMREKGANLALPVGATLQHGASLDVTAEIISRLDKALPRVSTTPPAQAPAGGGR